MAMEWERMVLGRRAGQTAEFSTIMLVSGSGRQKHGAGLAGYPPATIPHSCEGTQAFLWRLTEGRLPD